MEHQYLLEAKGISKRFGGVQALQKADLQLLKGECHALLGANGAGKSTLIKVLAGIYKADEGEIFIEGEKVEIPDVHTSHALGISVIHQELVLVPYMTIAENIFMGRELVKGPFHYIDKQKMNSEAQRHLDSFGLNLRATDLVSNLSVAQQQMVEICKAMSLESKLIIMDEPTAALTSKEVDQLFEYVGQLKKRNISVVYVSHRLEELFAITDRISIYRDGEYIDTFITASTDRKTLVNNMVGRSMQDFFASKEHAVGRALLEVKNLTVPRVLDNISFTLHEGEILGFTGIVGAGRTELMQTLFGIRSYTEGQILLDGQQLSIKTSQDAIKARIGLVPESRKEHGLNLMESIGNNITIQVLDTFIRGCFVNRAKEQEIIKQGITNLNIKAFGPKQLAKQLSGGNQQKVVIAKWLALGPRVLILDEPTRGIDVGAKAEIYRLMTDLVSTGLSIIMVSSELPEVMNMSDRILVMHQGRITGSLSKSEATQEKIMFFATGGSDE
ncbi:sugar ABC transporter ATP-binding protein [uncultured Sphaerochaeta sp.]|uniref:sugar ABC transporter ATP-binding protein n=1 Tax=uncultured Sphaerochaeta sp. TaxID=886478 RepID=UPI002A0A9511|nr:sugar ABC transporter ATP-binding protein [uncultured Sphaerochaeta sp.]